MDSGNYIESTRAAAAAAAAVAQIRVLVIPATINEIILYIGVFDLHINPND